MLNANISHVWTLCIICKICKKTVSINEKISRAKVSKWLSKYPRSAWWINNMRIANYCRIPTDDKVHNTTILGKYLPRGQQHFQRAAGLFVKIYSFDCVIVLCYTWKHLYYLSNFYSCTNKLNIHYTLMLAIRSWHMGLRNSQNVLPLSHTRSVTKSGW